jgi:hypothetical protein
VNLRTAALTGTGGDREGQVAESQHVPVDRQVGDVVVGTQHRQDDSAVGVGGPVDVEERGERRVPAVAQDTPPPRVVLGCRHPDMVGHDVDDQSEPACLGRLGQSGQAVLAAEFGRDGGGVGDVVPVGRGRCGGEDGGQVQMADTQPVEVVEQFLSIGERERVT